MGETIRLTARVTDDGAIPPQVIWTLNWPAGWPEGRQEIASRMGSDYGVPLTLPVKQVPWYSLAISATAVDSAGQQTTADHSLTVLADQEVPLVTLVSPAPGARHVRGTALVVRVEAQDHSPVQVVELYRVENGQAIELEQAQPNPIGPDLYAAQFVLPPDGIPAGALELRLGARARDRAGNVGTATPEVAVTLVDDAPPELKILHPAPNAKVVRLTTQEFLVEATDDVEVSQVRLVVGGIEQLPPEPGLRPYRFLVPIPVNAPDRLIVQATALDGKGQQTTSAEQSLVAVNDEEGPAVSFSRPVAGSRLFAGRPVTIEVTGMDEVGAVSATLAIGGEAPVPMTPVDETGFFRTFVAERQMPAAPGTLRLEATLTDRAGNSTTQAITVEVVVDRPPRVSVIAPAPGTTYTEGQPVRLWALAEDDDRVTRVCPEPDTVPSGCADVPAAYDKDTPLILDSYVPHVASAREVELGVTAYDNGSPVPQQSTATIAIWVLTDPQPPSVQMDVPPPGVVLEGQPGQQVLVEASGTDDVRIVRMEAVLTSAEGGEVAVVPLPQTMSQYHEGKVDNPLQPGQVLIRRWNEVRHRGTLYLPAVAAESFYELTVRAFDARPERPAVSAPVRVRVVPVLDVQPPVISLALEGTPQPNICVAGATVEVVAKAMDLHMSSLTLTGPWGVQATPPLAGSNTWWARQSWTAPPYTVEDAYEPIRFFAEASDTSANVAQKSLECQLVEDLPPRLAILAPAPGATLVEGHRHAVRGTVEDDVGVTAWAHLLSEDAPAALDAHGVHFAAPGQPAMAEMRLTVGAVHALQIEIDGPGEMLSLRLAPVAEQGASDGRLLVDTLDAAREISVAYHWEAASGAPPADGSATATGAAAADLSFAPGAFVPASVVLTLEDPAVPGVALPLKQVKVDYAAGRPYRVALHVGDVAGGGAEVYLWGLSEPVNEPRPGRIAVNDLLEMPVSWESPAASLTLAALDTQGQLGQATRTVLAADDLHGPAIRIASPVNGEAVLAGQPVRIEVEVEDGRGVARVGLLVDDVEQDHVDLPGSSPVVFTTTFVEPNRLVELRATATDMAGNPSLSDPIPINVVLDGAPRIELLRLRSELETVSRYELSSGFVRLLQGTPATLTFRVTDDMAVAGVTVHHEVAGQLTPLAVQGAGADRTVSFAPPEGYDELPSVLHITAYDGHVPEPNETKARIIVAGKRPQGPVVAISAPAAGAGLPEGSIRLYVQAVAADDIGVAKVDFELEGQRVLEDANGRVVEGFASLEEPDELVAFDPAVRAAIEALPPPYDDPARVRVFGGWVQLPPAFVDRARRDALSLRAVAVDREGNRTATSRLLDLVPDSSPPIVEFVAPVLEQDVVENTPLLIRVLARDDVLVEQVEVFAGAEPGALAPIHTRGGFPRESTIPSDFHVYAPLVEFEHQLPRLATLSPDAAKVPYYVAARALDVNGLYSELYVQPIDIVRDREPALAIIAPDDGDPAVEGSSVPVILVAEDDVAIVEARLEVVPITAAGPGEPLSLPTLHEPPYVFLFDVPGPGHGVQELWLQARAVDTYGHEVFSQELYLVVVEDEPPAVAIGYPRSDDVLVEGVPVLVRVAAVDDVEVASVELHAERTFGPTLDMTAVAPPYNFRIPIPPGAAGGTLTLEATARDSAGQTARSPRVSVTIQSDQEPPEIEIRTPLHGSSVVAGSHISVEAVARDNVAVEAVSFSVDGGAPIVMPQPPFRFVLPVGQQLGPLTIRATAVDASQLEAVATARVEVIQDHPPEPFQLVGPLELVVGRPGAFRAPARDDVGVWYVGLYATALPEGGGEGECEAGGEEVDRSYLLPFEMSYLPAQEELGGRVRFCARAVDTAGQARWSEPPLIATVRAPRSPSVALVNPPLSVFAGSDVRLEASTFDPDDTIVAVAFLVNGSRVDLAARPELCPGCADPLWRGGFRVPARDDVSLRVMAVALTEDGGSIESEPAFIAVVQDDVRPTADIVEPAAWDVVTEGEITRFGAASRDNAGVARVEFFVDGELIGSSASSHVNTTGRDQFDFDWLPAGIPGETRRLMARASDASGNTGSSEELHVELGMRPIDAVPPPPVPTTIESFSVSPSGMRLAAVDRRIGHIWTYALDVLGGDAQGQQRAECLAGLVPIRRPSKLVWHGETLLLALVPEVLETPISPYQPPVLELYDVRELAMPQVVDRIELPPGEPKAVVSRDDLAFVAMGEAGIIVLDIAGALAGEERSSVPMRLTTVDVVGAAQDLALHETTLIVAAREGGLRVHDLEAPGFPELGGTAVGVPGDAMLVQVVGGVALVGCSSPQADIAVIDLGGQPKLVGLTSLAIVRRDVTTRGVAALASFGNVVLAAMDLDDQEALPVKGLMTLATFDRDGQVRVRSRANLLSFSDRHPRRVLALAEGLPLAQDGSQVPIFSHPTLRVVDTSPFDGEEHVQPGEERAVRLRFSDALDATSLTYAEGGEVHRRVRLHRGDPFLGEEVPVQLEAAGAVLTLEQAMLLPQISYHLVVEPEVASDDGLTLGHRYIASFTTRATEAAPPVVDAVVPDGGTIEGGTPVSVRGSAFVAGARVWFGDAEASDVVVAADGNLLTARTPPHSEGPVTVRVVNPDGGTGSRLGGYKYAAALEVTVVLPSSGLLVGGDIVEVTGAGFVREMEVFFGDMPAPAVRTLSPGRLRVTTPPHGFGPVDVTVIDPSGRTAVAEDAFMYTRLRPAAVLGRNPPRNPSDPSSELRALHRLPRGTPAGLAAADGIAWLTSRWKEPTGLGHRPRTPEELILGDHGALTLVDLSVPESPSILGGVSFPPPLDPVDVALGDGLAYVATSPQDYGLRSLFEGAGFLAVVDGAEPTAPVIRSIMPALGTPAAVAVAGDLALVAAGSAGLLVYSLIEPASPVLAAQLQDLGLAGARPIQVEIDGRYAFVTSEVGTVRDLRVLDLALQGYPVIAVWRYGNETILGGDVAAGRGLAWSYRSAMSILDPAQAPLARPVELLVKRGDKTNAGVAALSYGAVGQSSLLHLLSTADSQRPVALDAISLWPALELADLAATSGTLVASIKRTDGLPDRVADDGLAVLSLPFPVVTHVSPKSSATGVPVTQVVELGFNGPIVAASASATVTVLDGSELGQEVAIQISGHAAGDRLLITPTAGTWSPGTRFRLRLQHVADPAGVALTETFTSEFETASEEQAAALVLSGIAPRLGPTTGGTVVQLTGSGFDQRVQVRFGGAWAEVLEVPDAGTLVVRTKPNTAGPVAVEVTHPAGGRALELGGFVYYSPLQITELVPAHGPETGGTTVQIRGSGFTSGARVWFGEEPAVGVRLTALDVLEVITPDGPVGPVDVRIQTDSESFVAEGAFTYDVPTQGAVGVTDRIHDILVIGDWAILAAGTAGLQIVDISGIYRSGPLAGFYIPPDRRTKVIDFDRDYVDDRVIARLNVGGRAISLAYPPDGAGGDRLFVGLGGRDQQGQVVEVDLSDVQHPRVVARQPAGDAGVWAMAARADRLLAAGGTAGLYSFDITTTPFWVHHRVGSAQSLAVDETVAFLGTGVRDEEDRVLHGAVELLGVQAAPRRLNGLPALNAQRIRTWRDYAVVAAGADGLVLIARPASARLDELADPDDLEVTSSLSTAELGGFAWDVRLMGDIAYVAVGAAGIAVVDLSDPLQPVLLRHMGSSVGEEARVVAIAGGRLVSGWANERGGWTFEYGFTAPLVVTGSTVADGDLVPVDQPSFTVFFSTVIDPASAAQAFALEVAGEGGTWSAIPGILEAGGPASPRSTIVFRPDYEALAGNTLPWNADLRLTVSRELTTLHGEPLLSPFSVRLRTARTAGARPSIVQIVPRSGLAGTAGQSSAITGFGLLETTRVTIGGREAPLDGDPTQHENGEVSLSVQVPVGEPGLADVRVWDPMSGLSDTRTGGYLYVAPVNITEATPRFFNPRGGTVLRLVGEGFLPASEFSSTKVLIRGSVEADSVVAHSAFELTAVVPAGSFGPAEVEVRVETAEQDISANNFDRSPVAHGYGLTFAAEERAVGVRPVALAPDAQLPGLIYAAPGSITAGNLLFQTINGDDEAVQAFRAVGYDVRLPGQPRAVASGTSHVDEIAYARLRALNGLLGGRAPSGDPDERRLFEERDQLLDSLKIGADALDIAVRDGAMLVANGWIGLAVLDPLDSLADPDAQQHSSWLQLAAAADTGGHAARLALSDTGALVASVGLVQLTDCPNTVLATDPPYVHTAAGTSEGTVGLYDVRVPHDPFAVRSLPLPRVRPLRRYEHPQPAPGPFGAALGETHALVVETPRWATFFCARQRLVSYDDGTTALKPSLPPPPELSHGRQGVEKTLSLHIMESRLRVFDRSTPAANPVTLRTYDTLTDALILPGGPAGDVAVVAAADYGLRFYEVSALAEAIGAPGEDAEDPQHVVVDSWPAPIHEIPFDETLSNSPGQPMRLRQHGDLLFVAAEAGSVAIVDVTDPRSPEVISAANEENAVDVLPVGDRLIVAGGDRLTELELPFSYVVEASPPRHAVVPPDLPRVELRFNRPIAAFPAGSEPVRVVDVSTGAALPLAWVVTNDVAAQRFTVSADLPPLAPDTRYRIEADPHSRVCSGGSSGEPCQSNDDCAAGETCGARGITYQQNDGQGGGLLADYASTFITAAAGAQQPEILALTRFLARAGAAGPGGEIELRGRGITSQTVIALGESVVPPADVTLTPAGEEVIATVQAPLRPQGGAVDLTLTDPSGLTARLRDAVLYLDDIAAIGHTLSPDDGGLAGGTRVEIRAVGGATIAPGTVVLFGGQPGLGIDMIDLGKLRVTSPRPPDGMPQVVDVALQRPGEEPVVVGQFSYDLERDLRLDLPGYPPRVIADLDIEEQQLFAAIPTSSYTGLEIFDIVLPERPIRVGTYRTDRPAYGVDALPGGHMTYLAADSLGLLAIATRDPSSSYLVARAPLSAPELATAVRLGGSYAYVGIAATGPPRGRVAVHDLSSAALVERTSLSAAMTEDVFAVALGSARLFTLEGTLGSKGLLTVRIYPLGADDDGVPVLAGGPVVGFALPDSIGADPLRARLAVRGALLYVTVGSRLLVYDLAPLLDEGDVPELLASQDTGARAGGIGFVGGQTYLATDLAGSDVVTVPPAHLDVVGVVPEPGSVVAPTDSFQLALSLPVQIGEAVGDEQPLIDGLVASGSLRFLVDGVDLVTVNGVNGRWRVHYLIEGSLLVFEAAEPLPAAAHLDVHVDGLTGFYGEPMLRPLHVEYDVAAEQAATRPVLTAVVPDSGHVSADGTFEVELRGSGLDGAAISFGGRPASDAPARPGDPADGTLRRVYVPAPIDRGPGPAPVTAEAGSLGTTRQAGFIYRAPLSLASITPNRGSLAGGNTVTLRGDGFAPGMAVSFGLYPSFQVKVIDPQTAEVRVPPAASPARVDVTATLANGEGSELSAVLLRGYTYGGDPAAAYRDELPIAGMVLEGTLAYVALGGVATDATGRRVATRGRMLVADVSEPGSIRPLALRPTSGTFDGPVHRVLRHAGYLLIAADSAGVIGYDVSDPANPVESFRLGGQPARDVDASGDLIAVATNGGVAVYRSGETVLPLRVGTISLGADPSSVRFLGRLLLVGVPRVGGAGRLHVVDAVGGSLEILSTIETAAPPVHLTGRDGRAYAGLRGLGAILTLDLSDPAKPLAGQYDLGDPLGTEAPDVHDLHLLGDVLHVAAGPGKVQRFLAPAPAAGEAPVLAPLDDLLSYGDARCLALRGDHLLVGTLWAVDSDAIHHEPPFANLSGLILTGTLDWLPAGRPLVRSLAPARRPRAAVHEEIAVELSELPRAAGAAAHVTLLREDAGGDTPLDTTLAVQASPGGGKLTVSPFAGLEVTSRYRLEIGPGLAGISGHTLGAAHVHRFETGAYADEQPPIIQAVDPPAGPWQGSDGVQILGEHLAAVQSVRFGGVDVVRFTVEPGGNRILVDLAGQASPGAVGVEVVTAGGLADLRLGAYRYLAAPSIVSVEPNEAPFNSRQGVRIRGEGLFAGTRVFFDGLPARSVSLDTDGALLATVPDGIIGPALVTVENAIPDAAPLRAIAPLPFEFTLPKIHAMSDDGMYYPGAVVTRGSLLFVASRDRLLAYDLALPETPLVASVDGVADPRAIVLGDGELWLQGKSGELVRYLLPCASAVTGVCAPREWGRTFLVPGSSDGFSSAVLAADQRTLAVADAGDVIYLQPRDQDLVVVGVASVTAGTILDLKPVGDAVGVLFNVGGPYYGTDYLELHRLHPASATSVLVQSYGEAKAFDADGRRIAIATDTEVTVADVLDDGTLRLVSTWTGNADHVDLRGPWLVALDDAYDEYAHLVDVTVDPAVARARTPELYYTRFVGGLVGDVLYVVNTSWVDLHEAPVPMPVAAIPPPDGTVAADGTLAVVLADRLDQLARVAAGTSLRVWANDATGTPVGAPLTGLTQVVMGRTVRFTPLQPLVEGSSYTVEAELGATAFHGGWLAGGWRYVVHAVEPAEVGVVVDAVTPGHGPVDVETAVTLSGSGLDRVSQVEVAGVLRQPDEVLPGSLRVRLPVAPDGRAGPVDLLLLLAGGGSLVLPTAFVYEAPLAITGVEPALADARLGEWVTVTGTGLVANLRLRVGDVDSEMADAALRSFAGSQLQAFVPAGPLGLVDFALSRPGHLEVVREGLVRRVDKTAAHATSHEPVGQGHAREGLVARVTWDEPVGLPGTWSATCNGTALQGLQPTLLGENTILMPLPPLPSRTSCTITLAGVPDRADQTSEQTWPANLAQTSWSFTTIDDEPPFIQSVTLDGTLLGGGPVPTFETGRDLVLLVQAADPNSTQPPTIHATITDLPAPAPYAAGKPLILNWEEEPPEGQASIAIRAADPTGNSAESTYSIRLQRLDLLLTDVATASGNDKVHLDGGTISLTGTGFNSFTEIRIRTGGGDWSAPLAAQWVRSTQMTAVVPAGDPALFDVQVRRPVDGAIAELAAAFARADIVPPAPVGIDPAIDGPFAPLPEVQLFVVTFDEPVVDQPMLVATFTCPGHPSTTADPATADEVVSFSGTLSSAAQGCTLELAGVADEEGNVAAPFAWTFDVVDHDPPAVVAVETEQGPLDSGDPLWAETLHDVWVSVLDADRGTAEGVVVELAVDTADPTVVTEWEPVDPADEPLHVPTGRHHFTVRWWGVGMPPDATLLITARDPDGNESLTEVDVVVTVPDLRIDFIDPPVASELGEWVTAFGSRFTADLVAELGVDDGMGGLVWSATQTQGYRPGQLDVFVPLGPPGPLTLRLSEPVPGVGSATAPLWRGDSAPPKLVRVEPLNRYGVTGSVPVNVAFVAVFDEAVLLGGANVTLVCAGEAVGTSFAFVAGSRDKQVQIRRDPDLPLADCAECILGLAGFADSDNNVMAPVQKRFSTCVWDIPGLVDSDGDGYDDAEEIAAGSNPRNRYSLPVDTLVGPGSLVSAVATVVLDPPPNGGAVGGAPPPGMELVSAVATVALDPPPNGGAAGGAVAGMELVSTTTSVMLDPPPNLGVGGHSVLLLSRQTVVAQPALLASSPEAETGSVASLPVRVLDTVPPPGLSEEVPADDLDAGVDPGVDGGVWGEDGGTVPEADGGVEENVVRRLRVMPPSSRLFRVYNEIPPVEAERSEASGAASVRLDGGL